MIDYLLKLEAFTELFVYSFYENNLFKKYRK